MITAIQRAVMPVSLAGVLTLLAAESVRALQTPVGYVLLATTAILFALRRLDREMRSSLAFKKRILLVGQRSIARRFLAEIERFPESGYTIVGVVEDRPSKSSQYQPFLILGTIDKLQNIVVEVKPDLIVVALSDRRGHMPVGDLLEIQSSGVRVEDVADAYERITGKLPIELVTAGQLIASQQLRKSALLKMTQRAISCSAAVLLLILFAPLFGLIALAIKLDTGGPVFFRQRRLGKGCVPFQLTKFRTMMPVERPLSEWVRDNSERITPVGRWLRKLRLDELPQLVNVIRGEMNLVGPRPHPVGNLQLFRDSIPYYTVRGAIRPGITGWAQVRYHYANNLEEETEKMRYDLYYIKHMSLLLDLKIVLKTCAVFIRSLRAHSDSDESVVNTLPFAVGPSRIHLRPQHASSPAAAAFDDSHRRPEIQL